MNKTIVVMEDDYFNRELTEKLLSKRFPALVPVFFKTEHEFHAAFPNLAANPPCIVILGARIKWTEPAPVMPEVPPEVRNGQYFEAGFRCWRMLRNNVSTKGVPVIFYTVIDERGNASRDILEDAQTKFVEMDIHDHEIIKALRQFLREGLKPGAQDAVDQFRELYYAPPRNPRAVTRQRCMTHAIAGMVNAVRLNWKDLPEAYRTEIKQHLYVDDSNPDKVIVSIIGPMEPKETEVK